MWPGASVSGWYFSHPDSKYYAVAQIQPGVEKFIKDFNDAKKKGEHAYDTVSYTHLLMNREA